MQRQNQWFLPGTGIAREVITADIQRYLGPNALVKPGDHQGQPGYWITAYRTLTSQMIQDLVLDSQRWQSERQHTEAGRGGGGRHSPFIGDAKVSRGPDASLVAYQDSQTHRTRQAEGPTNPFEPQQVSSNAYEDHRRGTSTASRSTHALSPGYSSSTSHYSVTPTPPQYPQSRYPAAPDSAAPRTQPADQYFLAYQPPAGRDTRDYPSQQTYAYPAQGSTGAYGQTTAAPARGYAATSQVAAPGYYIASDGLQYPIAQQPQTQPTRNPQPGASSRYSSQRER